MEKLGLIEKGIPGCQIASIDIFYCCILGVKGITTRAEGACGCFHCLGVGCQSDRMESRVRTDSSKREFFCEKIIFEQKTPRNVQLLEQGYRSAKNNKLRSDLITNNISSEEVVMFGKRRLVRKHIQRLSLMYNKKQERLFNVVSNTDLFSRNEAHLYYLSPIGSDKQHSR